MRVRGRPVDASGRQLGSEGFSRAHNSTLQAVARTAQQDLLLLDLLLRRHLLFGVETRGEEGESDRAAKHGL